MLRERNVGFEGFPQRLKSVLKENKISQIETAKHIGISKHSFTKYVNGRIPEPSILFALSKFFNKPMEWFLTGKTKKTVLKESSYSNDLELEKMCDVLEKLMSSSEENLREWTIIQFTKAFGEYYSTQNTDKKKKEVNYTKKNKKQKA